MKEGKEPLSLGQDKTLPLFYLLLFFLPTQFGKHFWPESALVQGQRIDYISPTVYVTDILIFLIFVLSARYIISTLLQKHKKQLLIFVLFTLTLVVGVSISKNPQAGVWGILKLLEFTFLGVFIYINKRSLNLNTIAIIFSMSIIFESLLAIFQYINKGSFQGIFYFLGERGFNSTTPGVANASIDGNIILRPYGTFSHPNVLAGYLVLSMVVCALLVKKLNRYYLIAFLIGICGVFISFSRTAIVALVLFIFSFFIISIYEKYKKGKLNLAANKNNLLLLLPLLFIIMLFLGGLIYGRFLNLNFYDESVSNRVALAKESVRMIAGNPVFGIGINNFFDSLNPGFKNFSEIQPVHNIFLLTFSETGIIGLSFLILLLTMAAKNNKLSFIAVFAVIILGSLDHYLLTLQQGQFIFTILISLFVERGLSARIEL